MSEETILNRSSWPTGFLLLLAPLAAILLHFSVVKTYLDVPDLDVVSDSRQAARNLPADQIWFASMPPDRPDLGAYRPVQGLLLRLQYELWPAQTKNFFRLNLVLLALLAFIFSLLVFEIYRGGLARLTAIALFVLHPAISEPMNWLSMQNILMAVLAWVTALWIYLLARRGKLSVWIASPILALCYFVAFGAYELGILLPLAMLSLEFLDYTKSAEPLAAEISKKEKSKKAKSVAAETEETEEVIEARPMSGLNRLLILYLPLLIVGIALLYLRSRALDHIFPSVQAFPDRNFFSRVVSGASIYMLGIFKLLFPFASTYFYPFRYEGLPMPGVLGVLLLALPAALCALLLWTRQRMLACALLLMLIPMLGLLQIFSMSTAFAERMLVFALPGFCMFVAGVIERIGTVAPESKMESPRLRRGITPAIGVVLLILALTTHARNRELSQPDLHWQNEIDNHPTAPQPLTAKIMHLVSRPKDGFDVAQIEEKSRKAISLAKPPDADGVYQYLILLHLQRRNPDDLKKVLEQAVQSPGPHTSGFLTSLAVAALRAGMSDVAQTALEKQLKDSPKDFSALYAMTELKMQKGDWPNAFETARISVSVAPSHMMAQALLNVGKILARMDPKDPERFQYATRALTQATERDPLLEEPYYELTRLYMDNGYYRQAEFVLSTARRKLNLTTFLPVYKLYVELLERQKLETRIFDYLEEVRRLNPYDMPFKLYAAGYYLEHGKDAVARPLYDELLKKFPNHPEVLFGMAKIVYTRDNDFRTAYAMLRKSLSINPQSAEAKKLLDEIAQKHGLNAPPPLKTE